MKALKILVADDDFDNRNIVQEVLEAVGYEVILAMDGEEALQKVRQEKPVLVLLDMSMPKLSGWQVAQQIRQSPELSGTYIIAFTAHALVGDELKAKASGCDDYLSKPCLPKDVVKKVAFCLEQQKIRGPREVTP